MHFSQAITEIIRSFQVNKSDNYSTFPLSTAGHCITIPHTNDVKNRRDLYLFLGKFYRSAGRNDENVQAIKPLKIVLHPDYNFANLDSDIAIVFLQKVQSFFSKFNFRKVRQASCSYEF